MHGITAGHWHEPEGISRKAGSETFKRPPERYDLFMQEQDIPIVRDFVESVLAEVERHTRKEALIRHESAQGMTLKHALDKYGHV